MEIRRARRVVPAGPALHVSRSTEIGLTFSPDGNRNLRFSSGARSLLLPQTAFPGKGIKGRFDAFPKAGELRIDREKQNEKPENDQ
jgi:hypothetical protein